jgi:hypothetical protein
LQIHGNAMSNTACLGGKQPDPKQPGRTVRKTPLFALPFISQNEHFTKTGSGQT